MLHFGSFDIRTDVFVLIMFVVVFLVQLLLCFKVKNQVIRLIPTYLFLDLTVIFAVLTFVFDGWDSVGFLFLAICTAALLFSCGIGWGVWWFVNRRKQKKGNEH